MADQPRCIFGNFVNELMVAVPDERHARALVEVAPRKIWLAEPGDLMVLPSEPPAGFWEYAHELLGIEVGDVEVITVDSGPLRPLATRIRELGLVDRLRDALAARPGVRVLPFAFDRPTLELFAELGVPLEGYDEVTETAVETAYRLNTKSGFRDLAVELGIPVVPGTFCPDRASLDAAVADLQSRGKGAVVKLNRSSNGFALLFLEADQDAKAALDAHLAGLTAQPDGWLVEEFMQVQSILTVEMWSHADGPELVHTGQMITPNGSFSGQLTPPREWGAHLDALGEHGLTWGRKLHDAGYRGPFDLDAITAGDELYVTETNVRRTGTTYLEFLIRRLHGDEQVTWLADGRVGQSDLSFTEAAEALREAGIAYADGVGVILTADTRRLDRKWRFLVLGRDHDEVATLEKRLVDVLDLT
ncbi:preATP grasp domain-containing protein [Lentzea sp. NPDC055074]